MIPIYLTNSNYEDSDIRRERGEYGVSKTDVWSFDIYMAKVMSNGLKELARQAHGWPQCEEFPTFESWIEELLRVATLFDCYTDVDGQEKVIWDSIPWNENDHQYDFESDDWLSKTTENEELWRQKHNAHEELQRKSKDEALAWMVKWWDALWD